ncbi:hypothetical protein Tco_0440401, partial [Tanacetum coccineum]
PDDIAYGTRTAIRAVLRRMGTKTGGALLDSGIGGAIVRGDSSVLISTEISKITRKQSKKRGKHGHENQKSSKRSQRFKAEARNVKP